MSELALFLMGPPRIERDGRVLNVDTRKATALITYLAVTKRPQSRDALAALLWPEYDQAHARATLRRTLSTLNKALAGNWLIVDRERVALDASTHIWVDADEFYSHLEECKRHGHPATGVCSACLDPLARAVSLYRDDFLAGFGLRDSPNFDDWQFFQADTMRRDLSNALERLVHGHSILPDYASAIAYARRWLALDRLHEPTYRYLMQLYAWSGQRATALHQYRECVQVLQKELGVAPLEATTKLYQAIKENQLAPPPVTSQAFAHTPAEGAAGSSTLAAVRSVMTMPASPASDPTIHRDTYPPGRVPTAPQPQISQAIYPLVGRSKELSTLNDAYASIQSDGRVVILEGEAGIGKTRLAEEFMVHIHARGATVLAARCYEGETNLAYGPVVSGLHTAIAQKPDARWLESIAESWLSEAARLLPELVTMRPGLAPAPPLDSPGAQSRFFEGLRQVLLAVCSGARPGVIFFDDVHWADSASLDLLSYLVRRLHDQPLCLVITWRSLDISNDQRLHHLLVEAQRSGKATIVSLSRLNRATVQELVQSVAASNSAISKGLAERLYQETEGLPFFLVEYLTALTKEIPPAGDSDWSLPGSVRDLLQSRLVAVSETGWQLLTTASVIGRSFDFDTLREASGRSEEETVTALEELISQGLVTEVRGAAGDRSLIYDFNHEKLRALVYEQTSLARRRLLHRRIAEVFAGRTRGHRDSATIVGQIAHHYQMAGNDSLAVEYYKLAGERARSLYANTEALTHLRLALALGHPEAAALHEAIGDLHTLLGEYGAALKSYETAAALCDSEALGNIEYKLGTVYERRRQWELAESHFEAALRALDDAGQAGERARVYASWSLTAHHQGQIGKSLELAQQALDLAEAALDARALAQAHNILGILTSSQGNLTLARHHLEHSLDLAESLNDPSIRAAALNNLARAYGNSGKFEQALGLAEDALALCISQGDRHREAALHNNLADLLHAAGRSEEAMSHLKQAVSIYAEIGVEAGTVQPEIWKLVEW
jgi:predicted ATPase/DNA-binding SARP family transcriptional activator